MNAEETGLDINVEPAVKQKPLQGLDGLSCRVLGQCVVVDDDASEPNRPISLFNEERMVREPVFQQMKLVRVLAR